MDADDILALLIINNHRKKRRPRRFSIRDIFKGRTTRGEMTLVRELENDTEYHHHYFRMDRTNFEYLLAKVGPRLEKNKTHSHPIPADLRLAMTLRFLACGNSQVSIGLSYRVSPSSMCQILREVLTVLWDELNKEYLGVPDINDWKEKAKEFQNAWQFPNCCGAMDGKHVRVKAFAHTGSEGYNHKNFFSIVLLAIIDAKYKFLLVDIGTPGSHSDSGILSQSKIGTGLDDGLNLPSRKNFPHSELRTPHVILGDGGFPLKSTIMKPFPRNIHLNKKKRIFNYRLSRARRVSENGFGILAARFRIFHKMMECHYDLAVLITKVSITLHNFLMSQNDYNNITADRESGESVIPGNWRDNLDSITGLVYIPNAGSNNFSSRAKDVRDTFTKYFNMPQFSLSWQDRVINDGQ